MRFLLRNGIFKVDIWLFKYRMMDGIKVVVGRLINEFNVLRMLFFEFGGYFEYLYVFVNGNL